MSSKTNVIGLKTGKGKAETPDFEQKPYRTPTAQENEGADSSTHVTNEAEKACAELDACLFVDIYADEKGKKAAIELIKSASGRKVITDAISTQGLDKAKVVQGLIAVMGQYHSGHIIRVRDMCEAAKTDAVPRRFLEESILPMLVSVGIIVKDGSRSTYWQPAHLIGKTPTMLGRAKAVLELTPEQKACRDAADKAHAEQQKLKALLKLEDGMKQQKAAYARIAAHQQQLAEMAAANPVKPGLLDKAKANPGATLLIGAIAASMLVAMMAGQQPVNDAPMPAVQAAMQAPTVQPDAGAVAEFETEQVRKQMMKAKP